MGVFKAISALRLTKKKVQAMENQDPRRPRILHQRQRRNLCLLHALNNLFQGDVTFTRCELDGIARSLCRENVQQDSTGFFSCLVNSHYNIFKGNYDANVLLRALQRKDADWTWCDPHTAATAIDLNDCMLVGFILHHTFVKGGHWSALRKIANVWYDLDSDLPEPEPVGESDEDVKRFLDQCFRDHASVLLVHRN